MNLSDPLTFILVVVGVALAGYGVLVFLREVIAQGIAKGLRQDREQQERDRHDQERRFP